MSNGKLKPATRFPFLSLPRELQAEVVRNVGDLVALRDLLAMPEVIKSVGPFLHLVTNESIPLWFDGLHEHVAHSWGPDGLPNGPTNRYGPVYILDLGHNKNVDPAPYRHLWKPIVVFTIPHSNDDEFECSVSKNILHVASVTGAQTVGVIGVAGRSCNINVTPDSTMLAVNLTLVGLNKVFSGALYDILDDDECYLPAIRYAGSLSSLELECVPSTTDPRTRKSLVYGRYKELIDCARRIAIFPDSAMNGDAGCGHLFLDNWEIPQLRSSGGVFQCYGIHNLKVNTAYNTETAGELRDGELHLEMEGGWVDVDGPFPPRIENVTAPGLHKLNIKTTGPLFPTVTRLWFPHLETLTLTGLNEDDGNFIRFDHLDSLHLEEISRLLHSVKDLNIDQFILPLLGYVTPFSLENLRKLTLSQSDADRYTRIDVEELGRLRMRYGKMHLGKLKELRWSTMHCDPERVLDFKQLSKWFTLPRLKSLVFETVAEGDEVSLKDIARQTPRIKVLEITKPTLNRAGSAPYMTPSTHPPCPATFERLERLVIRTAYQRSMFDGVLFPHLKSLELYMSIGFPTENPTVQGNMPVLEDLLLTTLHQTERSSGLTIGDFKSLKKVVVNTDLEALWFSDPSKLEQITHKGRGLRKLDVILDVEVLGNLKILRYTSLNGNACHNFLVSALVDVDIR